MITKPQQHRSSVFVGNIPEELKTLKQWTNWSAIWDDAKEKFNKPPMKASGRNGSSTDEKTWTTLGESFAALGRGAVYVDNGGKRHHVTLDGVGFAGLERTPYTGIDLDHCIGPKTGEINPAARKIVDDFDSYAEITPSGEGLRIWIEAEKHSTWTANKAGRVEIEVYTRGRFFTVTGQHLEGTPRTIEARQEALNAFMVEYAPSKRLEPKFYRPRRRSPLINVSEHVFDLDGWLETFGVAILGPTRDRSSERAYYIVCPWAHEHTGGDPSGTRVGQYRSGGL
jgi:putative DNA primase/helicase